MNLDQAIAETIKAIKDRTAGEHGYDVYPARICINLSRTEAGHDPRRQHELNLEYYPHIADAAFELCNRGILRPGIKDYGAHSVSELGYSLTVSGAELVEDLDDSTLLLVQPGSLAEALAECADKFGEGFLQRSQEAVKSRNSSAWLACCAMAGAAAESVLLAVAIAKTGDENLVLKKYKGARGRQEVLNLIVGTARKHIREKLTTFTGIISLWRDEASHGGKSEISMASADEAMRQLLHMSKWVLAEWDTLTK